MKPVLAWLKSNIAIVVLGIVILAVPVAGFFVSGTLNAGLREQYQGPAEKDYRALTNANVNYVIPGLPGLEEISESAPPNAAMVEFFREKRAERAEALDLIVVAGEAFARGEDRGPILPRLLPNPPASSQSLRFEMAARVTPEVHDGERSVYDELLDRIGAVGPADLEQISGRVTADLDDALSRLEVDSLEELPEEQSDSIRGRLVERRIAEYQRHARDGAVYLTIDALPGVVPTSRPAEAPGIVECFRWQFDYWVISDVLGAVRSANAEAVDDALGILAAPVKRVLAIGLDEFPLAAASAGGDDRRGGRDNFGGDPRDPRASERFARDQEMFGDPNAGRGAPVASGGATITGRSPGPGQTDDIRLVRLSLVVASSELPEVYNALGRQGFFTVVDTDITEVDVRGDLADGYYYGPEPVVRLDLTLETVWLRSWTSEAMPVEVKQALGIPVPGAEGELDDGGA